MTHFTRADWGARPSRGGVTLTPARMLGLAFHWPATSSPIRGTNAVAAALRSWQDFHMDSRKWSDIAYQVAVDQDGNRWELRGLRTRSGANGDTALNESYGAVLLILAPGEKPTAAMIAEVRRVVGDFRALYPRGTRLVGHGEIRPGGTECPGPAVRAALAGRVFEPASEPEPKRRPKPVRDAIKAARIAYRAAKGETQRKRIKRALDALREIKSR